MTPAAAPAAAHRLILLVEDDVALGRALRFALEIEGYRVELMDRAEALLDRVFPSDPACIVADLHLPGRPGIDALEVLRRQGVTAPAILMTTQPTRALRARARRADVVVLEKPLLGDRLVETIRSLWDD